MVICSECAVIVLIVIVWSVWRWMHDKAEVVTDECPERVHCI